MRDRLASVLLWFAVRLCPALADTFEAGLAFQRRQAAEQPPETVQGMGWVFVPWNTKASIRVIMERVPSPPKGSAEFVAVVDKRGGGTYALGFSSWAKLAINVMGQIDVLESEDLDPGPET